MDKKTAEKLCRVADSFNGRKIAVFGDLMLDRFIAGKVRRISPEAPVPVIEVTEEKSACGGAGNVANNISSLGGSCLLVSVIGEDEPGRELLSLLNSKTVDVSLVIPSSAYRTIEKTRIMAEHQQVARVDREIPLAINPGMSRNLIQHLETAIKKGAEAVILSDYGKGILIPETIKSAIALCEREQIPVFVDPKVEHFKNYKKVSSITPNVMEAFLGMRQPQKNSQEEIEKLGIKTVKELKLKSLVITQSENGMTIFENSGKRTEVTHLPTRAREVYDVTGAGDTVISAMSLAYAACGSIKDSALLANHAAGIVVAKLGTAAVSAQELKEEIKSWTKR